MISESIRSQRKLFSVFDSVFSRATVEQNGTAGVAPATRKQAARDDSRAAECLPRGALLFAAFGLAVSTLSGQVPLSNTKPSAASTQHTMAIPVKPVPIATPQIPLAGTITIPGPLRSFLRMLSLSQQAPPADVLSLLAVRVYQAGFRGEAPTEFLKLVQRYVAQARELQALAGPTRVIEVANCTDSAKLLQILGYRLQACGTVNSSLQTENAERAFLTVDSGFPLADLEEALQRNVPFVYPYGSAPLPVTFQETDWIALSGSKSPHFSNLLDLLLNDRGVARLYRAMSNIDLETSQSLRLLFGLKSLMPIAPALDFYGSELSIRTGRVSVPGGFDAEPAWRALVGASPETPASFLARLYSKDDGWLAAYFDGLSRLSGPQQELLVRSSRLEPYYEAFRFANRKGKAAAGSFPKTSQLLALDARLTWTVTGEPHIPGSMKVWRKVLQSHPNSEIIHEWLKRGHALATSDDIVAAVIAASGQDTETSPLQLYLSLCELDRRRGSGRQISEATAEYLAENFVVFDRWYPIFPEFPTLSDASIALFLDTAKILEEIPDVSLRANALGAFQSNLGLLQILARQHEIPDSQFDASWRRVIEPFEAVTTPTQLFDSARRSLQAMLTAAGCREGDPPSVVIDLLAGPVQESLEGQRVRSKLVDRIRSVLEDQQLVPLDTLFALSDGLEVLEQGRKPDQDLVSLAMELRGFALPQPIFTPSEKVSFAPGIYMSRHAELQVQTDISRVIGASATRVQIEGARGQLSAFLRDTLVGLNYAFYEPPGAQILHVNPLFVRAHDFLGVSVVGTGSLWRNSRLVGAGISAGGGAYLMGSLADLPFSLAKAEEDFIVPDNVQALIWKEVVPNLVSASTLPRWWDVSPDELHAVALYQRCGEEILHSAATDPTTRANAALIFAQLFSPHRSEQIQDGLSARNSGAASLGVLPAEALNLAERYRALFPEDLSRVGSAGRELMILAQRSPVAVDPEQLSLHFGVPHPSLAHSNSPEVLGLFPVPMSSGFTNRFFAESMESSNLYWARVTDELGQPPAMLQLLVPQLTRVLIEKLFASDIEDWPAVMRAMQESGDDLRRGRPTSLPKIPVQASVPTSVPTR